MRRFKKSHIPTPQLKSRLAISDISGEVHVSLRFVFNLVVTVSLALPGGVVWADCEDDAKKLIKQCSDITGATAAGNTAAAQAASIDPTSNSGLNPGAGALQSVAKANGTSNQDGANKCSAIAEKCKLISCSDDDAKKTKTNKAIKECTDGITPNQQAMKQQSAADGQTAQQAGQTGQASGSGSGSNPLTSMMPALAAAAAGYMMAKASQTPPAATPTPYQQTGALNMTNGQFNCQYADGYQYTECDSYNTQVCATAPTVAGVTTTTTSYLQAAGVGPNCAAFNARYCAQAATQGSAYLLTLPNGGASEVDLGGSGTGATLPYCQTTVAAAYCADGTKSTCPTCQKYASTNSQACAQNPALCLASTSSQTIASAKLTCPDDPMVTGAASAYTSASTYASTVTSSTIGATTGIASTVLPQSVTPSGSQSSVLGQPLTYSVSSVNRSLATAAGRAASIGASAPVTSSVSSTGGVRDGFSTGGFVSSSNSYSIASVGARETTSGGMASGISSIAGVRTASAAPGPASDVSGEFGPSLFATSTNAIRQRCQAGKLNNCP